MPTDDELLRVWRAFTNVAHPFFAAGPTGARLAGPGWFAALANEPSGELNVSGLTPEATVTSARALVSSIATDPEWRDDTEFAVLLATPAGRRLYESIGFEADDEVMTRFRGLEDELLAAIGQPG